MAVVPMFWLGKLRCRDTCYVTKAAGDSPEEWDFSPGVLAPMVLVTVIASPSVSGGCP